jgi:hypothetical protein
MSAQTNAVSTGSSLNKFWRKIQGNVAVAFAHGKRPEKQFYNSLTAFEAAPSAYEVTFPLDIAERGGVASITDGGFMAKASSVNAQEATVSAVHFNARFSISDISKYSDRGMANQLARQIVVQAKQKAEAHNEHFADYFHGTSSAVLATSDSDISGTSGQAITLAAGYGTAGITNAKFLASMWKVGDRGVALSSADALIDGADSFFEVTGVNKTTGVITVTFDGSVTYSTNGMRLYKANNLEGTTAAGGSDLSKGLVGLQDIFEATSLHNVSGSTYANWTAAYSDTNAGLFTPAKFRRGKDEIMNDGGVEADTLFLAQGVYRSMLSQERAGLRYEDAAALSFDGDVKAKGVKIISTKGVPPGYVRMMAKSALNKWEILPTTDNPSWGDLQPSETLAGAYGRVDWYGNVVCKNRKGLAYWTSATEA